LIVSWSEDKLKAEAEAEAEEWVHEKGLKTK